MTDFDRIYAEVQKEKIKRKAGLKQADKFSKRIGFVCKILDGFSKSVKNGTAEKIVRSIVDSD